MLQRVQQLIADHLLDFIAIYEIRGRTFPFILLRELQLFLTCGEPRHGSAVMGCSACGFCRVIYYSCKRRSMCWRCLIRRRDERIPHLMRSVLPRTPMRQWVLNLPAELRMSLRHHPAVMSGVRQRFLRAIFQHLRMKAKQIGRVRRVRFAHPGAISVTHLVSANLNPNVHIHAVVIDGIFVEHNGAITFVALPAPTSAELAKIAWRVCRQTLALLRRHKLWTDCDPTLPNTIRGVVSLRAPRTITLSGVAAHTGDPASLGPRPGDVFEVFAGDIIPAWDRIGLRNLMLYLLSPPFTGSQLTILNDGTVRLQLRRPRRDGTTQVTFDPYEFIAALLCLIQQPRSHSLEYHGVLGRNSRLRNLLPQWHPKPRPENQDVESPEDRRARLLLYIRAHRDEFTHCPKCFNKLQLVALDTQNLRYTNPRWRQPDTPDLPAVEPGSSPETRQAA